MRSKIIKTISLLFIFSNSYSFTDYDHQLPLDLTSYEYQQLLKESRFVTQDKQLEKILNFGKRNLELLDHLNQFRTEKLNLTSPETMTGHGITEPIIYSKKSVLRYYRIYEGFFK